MLSIVMPKAPSTAPDPRRLAENRRPHYMRHWRHSHGLTLKQMAAAINQARGTRFITGASLSRIETGDRQYTQDILEAYAEIIGCHPADLLSRAPRDPIEVFQTLVETAEDILRISRETPRRSTEK